MSLRSGIAEAQTEAGRAALSAKQAYLDAMYGEKPKKVKRVKKGRAALQVRDADAVAVPGFLRPRGGSDSDTPAVHAPQALLRCQLPAAPLARPTGAWETVAAPQQPRPRPGSDSSEAEQPSRPAPQPARAAPPAARGPRHDSDSSDEEPARRPAPPAAAAPAGAPRPRPPRHDSDSSDAEPVRPSAPAPPVAAAAAPPPASAGAPQSPPRGARPPLKRPRCDSSSDQSVERPPPAAAAAAAGDAAPAPAAQMADGTSAGLRSKDGAALDAQELRRREEERWARARPEDMGLGARAQHRRKGGLGKLLDEEEVAAMHEARRPKDKHAPKPQRELSAQEQMWGAGVVQTKAREAQAAEDREKLGGDFARPPDDATRDAALRARVHADDPMRLMLEGSGGEEPPLLPHEKLSKKERKRRVKAIAEAAVRERPTYKGRWPPNRFNIPPGHRWDGKDRGNGFEAKLFAAAAKRNAAQSAAKEAWTGID